MKMIEHSADYRLISVVSPHFCVPRSMDLAITKKIWQIIGNEELVVNDVHGNLMFKVERSLFRIDRKRLILDSTNIPVITLQKKVQKCTRNN